MYGLVSTKPYDDPIRSTSACFAIVPENDFHYSNYWGCIQFSTALLMQEDTFLEFWGGIVSCTSSSAPYKMCSWSQVRKVVGMLEPTQIDGFYSLACFTKNPKKYLIVRFIPISYLTISKDSKLTYVLPKKEYEAQIFLFGLDNFIELLFTLHKLIIRVHNLVVLYSENQKQKRIKKRK